MSEAAAPNDDGSEILFAEGIIGVPRARRFQLLERKNSPIRVLRCLDIEGFALPVADPRLADPHYLPDLARATSAVLLEQDDPLIVLAVATLDPDGAKVNLRAPLLINARRRIAAQVILDDRSLPLRAPVAAGKLI